MRPESATESTFPVSRLRWAMIGLAFLATVINYLDRQTLSVVAPVIREQFQMSNTAYAQVVFAFMLAYTIMNGVSGPLIDRLGTRRGYALCMFWWTGASLLHAISSNAWTLGLYRFLLGMGEAGNWPAAVKVVAEWFPARERALASGIFNSGSAIGAVVAPPLVAWITLQYGWRQAFLIMGSSGFLWLALWGWLYHTPATVAKEVAEPPPPALRLLRQRFVWSLTLAKVFFDPVWYFYIFWFPQYLSSARGFDLAAIGKTAWIPFLTADVGNLFGGWFSGTLIKRGMAAPVARKVSMTLFAAMMTSAIPAVLAQSAGAAIALVSAATFGYTACLANMLALPSDAYPKNTLASIWGLASMGSGFGGMLFALITGWVVDHYSYVPVFVGFGILPLISASILLFVMGPVTPAGRSETPVAAGGGVASE